MHTTSITTDLRVESGEASLRLTHVTARQAREEFDGSIPIEASRYLGGWWSSDAATLGLAETRVALQYLFGDSGPWFDPYKSTFCYLFRMVVRKRTRVSTHLVRVGDWRGGFDVTVFRPEDRPEGQAGTAIRDFLSDEFSRSDYFSLVNDLRGLLEGALRTIRATRIPIEDFASQVDNELVVYGYENGEPFERTFEDYRDYERECARLRALTPRRAP